MKLEKILDQTNSFEKNSFLKIINDIIANKPTNIKEIDKILSADDNKDLKNIENINVAKVYSLVEYEFSQYIKKEFVKTSSQLDILIDILIRDGNCIIKQDWFSRLYDIELKKITTKVKELKKQFEGKESKIDLARKRDYEIYKACLNTAYTNDDAINSDRKITTDELSILLTLSNSLELSQEEIKLINYLIIPIEKSSIDYVINELKNLGIIFFSKKQNTVFIADEIVRTLRKVRGKDVADKFFRRTLRLLRDSQINLICKKHNINWKLPYNLKIKEIINEGISFKGVLMQDIYKPNTTITEKKKTVSEICDKGLQITPQLRGATIDEKIHNLINYFESIEKDEKVGISIDGYDQLLLDLHEISPNIKTQIKEEFELQSDNVLNNEFLLDYNIKPRDILEILDTKLLEKFCKEKDIKTRGDIISNILSKYKDSENIFIENYINIGNRDLKSLKDNGIKIKEADLGVKFEDLTKKILNRLGFNIDENLRKKLNTKKDKLDILINLGNNELILVECKSAKESGYNKFSSVSRQLRSYTELINRSEYKLVKSLLIAPDFSDDFITECELEYELNLSLISASSLIKILEGFKKSKLKTLPYKLLMRDVLIKEDRILKAIK